MPLPALRRLETWPRERGPSRAAGTRSPRPTVPSSPFPRHRAWPQRALRRSSPGHLKRKGLQAGVPQTLTKPSQPHWTASLGIAQGTAHRPATQPPGLRRQPSCPAGTRTPPPVAGVRKAAAEGIPGETGAAQAEKGGGEARVTARRGALQSGKGRERQASPPAHQQSSP